MSISAWKNSEVFVNCVLSSAVALGLLSMEEVELDGVAGEKFDRVIAQAQACSDTVRNHYIDLALKLDAPVSGLEADGEFGEKWRQVMALCKPGGTPTS